MENGHSFWNIHEDRATDIAVTSWYETVDMGGEIFGRTAQYDVIYLTAIG